MAHQKLMGYSYDVFDEADFEFNMRHMAHKGSRGRAILITNNMFDDRLELPRIVGARELKDRLKDVMRFAGFKPHEILEYNNLPAKAMVNVLYEASHFLNWRRMDCLFVIIQTYGDRHHNLYATDRIITSDMLLGPLKGANMANIPKIFMIQATPAPTEVSPEQVPALSQLTHDSPEVWPPGANKPYPISRVSDFLWVYSLLKGSMFIEAFCEIMRRDGRRLEIIELFTRVTRIMSYQPNAQPQDVVKPNKSAPAPFIFSLLTKSFYFL